MCVRERERESGCVGGGGWGGRGATPAPGMIILFSSRRSFFILDEFALLFFGDYIPHDRSIYIS